MACGGNSNNAGESGKQKEGNEPLVKVNNNNVADQVGKKVAKKTAGITAKYGLKFVRWLIVTLVSFIGLPLFLTLICVVIAIFVLPGMIIGGTMGMDSTQISQIQQDGGKIEAYMDTLDKDEFREWETAAEQQLDLRSAQLSSNGFWSDLKTFFTTGTWGTAQETFKTEYANADDIDSETGESVSVGYFSSSNRLIAIIDEAFRASLRDDTKSMKMAKKAAKANEEIYRTYAATNYPQPSDADDYRIDFEIKKDPELENEHFIYESCYMVAASSVKATVDDTYSTSVKDLLDYTFKVTGLDDDSEDVSISDPQICWTPMVTPSYETTTETYVKGHKYYDADDNEVSEDSPDKVRTEDVMGVRYIVTITAEYRVNLAANFKDLVNDMCGFEPLDDDAPAYDVSQEEWVRTSAVEIMKFYNASHGVELGEVGLPLPAGSYTISSPFGMRDLFGGENHGGVDLAAPRDTPIYAVKGGICQVSGHDSSYGVCVTITHEGGIKTRYAHQHYTVVRDGEEVEAGQLIGYVGNSGRATGNHLHFEVIDASGQRTDPLASDVGPLIEQNKRG